MTEDEARMRAKEIIENGERNLKPFADGYDDYCKTMNQEFNQGEFLAWIAAIECERSREKQKPESVEQKLINAGVFKGEGGLEGLYNASEFWDSQPYGTRLYYGPGAGQYLHRSVLGAAIELLAPPKETQVSDKEKP